MLDALNFELNLVLPRLLVRDAAFLVFSLVLADRIKFSLLLDLEECLLHTFREENVKNWLDFAVIFEQVVVPNLSDLVNTSLLGHIAGRFRLWVENVRLTLHFILLRHSSPLLCQEVG